MQRLEQDEPAVIGLDNYRDLPVEPGHAALANQLQKSDRIITVCQLSDDQGQSVPPPPSVQDPESRVGFSDFVIDPDGIVRRGLLFLYQDDPSGCTVPYSFNFQIARRYLEQQGIQPELIEQDGKEYLKLGNVLFKPLIPNAGGYQQAGGQATKFY